MVGSGIYDPSGVSPIPAYGLIAETLEFSDDRSWWVFQSMPRRSTLSMMARANQPPPYVAFQL